MRGSKSHFTHAQIDLRPGVLAFNKASTPKSNKSPASEPQQNLSRAALTKRLVASEEAEGQKRTEIAQVDCVIAQAGEQLRFLATHSELNRMLTEQWNKKLGF